MDGITKEKFLDLVKQTKEELDSDSMQICIQCSKVGAKMLDGIGAKVSCEARKHSDIAWIKAYGYNPIMLSEIDTELGNFDIIINTIPFQILEGERLDYIKKECVIIDLSANPGGVDRKAAKEKNLNVIWALSVAGKVAPITSAEFIKETLFNILKEI